MLNSYLGSMHDAYVMCTGAKKGSNTNRKMGSDQTTQSNCLPSSFSQRHMPCRPNNPKMP